MVLKRPRITRYMSRSSRRKYTRPAGRAIGRTRRPVRRKSAFARSVMRAVNKNAETKCIMRELGDTQNQLNHNKVKLIDGNAFYTKLGNLGEGMSTGPQTGSRIGKKIYAKGIKLAINLETIQKRPHVTYWIALIRNKKYPSSLISSKSQIFEELSTTIPMDYIDTDKVHVKWMKKITTRMPNAGTSSAMLVPGFAPTWQNTGDPQMKFTVTNPQKIQKYYIPLNQTITYNDFNDGESDSFAPISGQRYQWVVWAYDTYGTPDSGADSEVGRIQMTSVLKFTDV